MISRRGRGHGWGTDLTGTTPVVVVVVWLLRDLRSRYPPRRRSHFPFPALGRSSTERGSPGKQLFFRRWHATVHGWTVAILHLHADADGFYDLNALALESIFDHGGAISTVYIGLGRESGFFVELSQSHAHRRRCSAEPDTLI